YRWGELRGGGETPDPAMLVPPSTEVRQSIKRLSLEANWGELLEIAETAMAQPCGRAWLDLQRYVVRAAQEYGYLNIASAVRSELRGLLADLIPRQQSGRARFQRKLQLSQICMMTGHEALAQPILEELARSIDEHRLENWEASDVVAHPLALLYRCLNKLHGDAEVKQKLY